MSMYERIKGKVSDTPNDAGEYLYRRTTPNGSVYQIKNSSNETLREIVAEESFFVGFDLKRLHSDAVSYNEKISTAYMSEETVARVWRNAMLDMTDVWESRQSHGQYSAYKNWRTALRDWPSTKDFPTKQPTLDV